MVITHFRYHSTTTELGYLSYIEQITAHSDWSPTCCITQVSSVFSIRTVQLTVSTVIICHVFEYIQH